MADSADIETALVALLGAALYPNGAGQSSLAGGAVAIQRGWPTEEQIAAAAAANTSIVSVHADRAMAADATRYFRAWQAFQQAPGITAAVSGRAVTLGGTIVAGNVVAVRAVGQWYCRQIVAGDTLAAIAALFGGAIAGASASGAVLTLPAGGPLPEARVGAAGVSSIEVGRQRQAFRICAWCPTPAARDALFGTGQIAAAIAYQGSRLTLPDGTVATWMHQQESGPDDTVAKDRVWRRDVLTVFDWPVIYSAASAPLIVLGIELEANAGAPAQIGDVVNTTNV